MGGTVFKRNEYDRGSQRFTVRTMLETKENDNEEAGADDESLDSTSRIDNYGYFLTVLGRDMNVVQEDFTKDKEVMDKEVIEKMKNFRKHVTDTTSPGAGIAKNQEECLQDIAAMKKMI